MGASSNGNLTQMIYEVSLSDKERNLIKELRKIPHGRVEIVIADSEPIRIVEIRETKKL